MPRSLLGLFLFLVLLGGCTSTRDFGLESYSVPATQPVSILLIDPDVEVSSLTTGGLLQPNRQWTEQARANLLAAIEAHERDRGSQIKLVRPDTLPPESAALFTDYERLHSAVGSAIAQYKYGSERLATKRNRFDWTLGPGAARLAQSVGGGSHALFMVATDSFASTGRVIMNIIGGLLGGGVATGQRFAYASLVDLTTGDIVWFNVLQSNTGDMRTPEGARATIDTLLRTMPTARAAQGGRVRRAEPGR